MRYRYLILAHDERDDEIRTKGAENWKHVEELVKQIPSRYTITVISLLSKRLVKNE